MSLSGATQDARAHDERVNKEDQPMNQQKAKQVRSELPGSSGSNPIPPTDSPEYKRLQAEFGTKDFLSFLK